MSLTTSALLAAMPRGRARATSIPALCLALGCSNRELREEAAGQLHSRAMSLLERCRALRIAGEAISWSPTLFPPD